MKAIIQENQRGFLFRNGRFVKMLEPGRYYIFGDRKVEIADLEEQVAANSCGLEVLLRDEKVKAQSEVITVPDEMLALHFVDGKFDGVLRPGKFGFWTVFHEHTFQLISTAAPEVSEEVPKYIFSKLPRFLYSKIEVAEYQKGLLYYDRKFVKLLDAGTYYFWEGSTQVTVETVDTRLTQMDITGQEILTQDKVTLRVNFVCSYRILDCVKALTEIDDFKEQLHVAAQLALREYVGKYRIDEVLENKEQMGTFVFERLQAKAKDLFVEVTDAGVKDIILPGEIRDIMNTVLVAEKRAQANVITRREEVASTRSLLNTAKLMDENQTLYRLKELEYLEKICENVGNITVNGGTDLLSQLSAVMKGGREA